MSSSCKKNVRIDDISVGELRGWEFIYYIYGQKVFLDYGDEHVNNFKADSFHYFLSRFLILYSPYTSDSRIVVPLCQ